MILWYSAVTSSVFTCLIILSVALGEGGGLNTRMATFYKHSAVVVGLPLIVLQLQQCRIIIVCLFMI